MIYRHALLRLFLSCLFVMGSLIASGAEQNNNEQWYYVSTNKGKLGYNHNETREVTRKNERLIHTSDRTNWVITEHGLTDRWRSYYWEYSTPGGELRELGYRVFVSDDRFYDVQGTVHENKIEFKILDEKGNPAGYSTSVACDPEIRGNVGTELALAKMDEAGQKIQIKEFDISLYRTVVAEYVYKGTETIEIQGTPQKLRRIECSYRRDDFSDPRTLWVDQDGSSLKVSEHTQCLGTVHYEQSTREKALAKFKPRVSMLYDSTKLDRPIKRSAKQVVLRFSLPGEKDHASLFPTTPRQSILSSDDKSVTLQLLRGMYPEKADPPSKEFLGDSFFLRPSDPVVQRLAKKVTDGVKGHRNMVRAISRYVSRNVEYDQEYNMVTADVVARELIGDCTACSILAVSMFRACGIPSRLASGFLFDEDGFYGHQWTEVYLDGCWETCDPAGDIGPRDIAWIKMWDSSMEGVIEAGCQIEMERVWFYKSIVTVVKDK